MGPVLRQVLGPSALREITARGAHVSPHVASGTVSTARPARRDLPRCTHTATRGDGSARRGTPADDTRGETTSRVAVHRAFRARTRRRKSGRTPSAGSPSASRTAGVMPAVSRHVGSEAIRLHVVRDEPSGSLARSPRGVGFRAPTRSMPPARPHGSVRSVRRPIDASHSRHDGSAAREDASGRTRRGSRSGCDVRACLRPTRSYLPQGRRPEDLFDHRPLLEHGPQTCPHGRRHRPHPSASVPPRPTERSALDVTRRRGSRAP